MCIKEDGDQLHKKVVTIDVCGCDNDVRDKDMCMIMMVIMIVDEEVDAKGCVPTEGSRITPSSASPLMGLMPPAHSGSPTRPSTRRTGDVTTGNKRTSQVRTSELSSKLPKWEG